MRPILFAGGEVDFTSNGLGRLSDVVSCIVTEERNGVYLCEFTIPVTSPMFSMIQEGRYIAVTHDDKHDIQPFEIYGRSASIDGLVTFYAHHLSYKLKNVILKPFTASSCAQALSKMETETYNRQRFTFWTDKSVSADFKNIVPASCRSLLAGHEGSILDVYGTGEYEFDKWAVKLHLHRGNDNGVAIRYGVNLTEIQQDTDASESYSAIAPYWKSEDGLTVVMLPEGYIVAENVPIQKYPWTTKSGEYVNTRDGEIIEFAVANIVPVPVDFSGDFQEAPTVAQLRARAEAYLENNTPWLPTESITVSFVDLAHTEDYKDVAALQRVSLCDRVSVYCGPLGVKAVSMQVVKTVYNVLTETYNEIELGAPRTNFADVVMAGVDEKFEGYAKTSDLEGAIEHATQLITGGLGGYVVFNLNANGEPQELLIMDTPDTSTAVNVWRFNKNGLGHSHNGYNGPFDDVALTYDGKINASMITTGYLNAAMIRGGTLLLGGNANGNGVLEIKNASGTTIGSWDKDGISVLAGLIKGPSIELGGQSNNYGTLKILDASGSVIGTWDKDGINASSGTFGGALNAATGTFAGTMSASNITSGTLSADRIAANSIAVSKLTGTISKTATGGSTAWTIDLTNGTLTIGDINAGSIKAGTMSADRISGGTINGNNVNVTNLSASNIKSGTLDCTNLTVTNLKAESISGVGTNPITGTFTTYRYVEQSGLEIEESATMTIQNGIIIGLTGYS